jgi:hypothetical protein
MGFRFYHRTDSAEPIIRGGFGNAAVNLSKKGARVPSRCRDAGSNDLHLY